MNVSNIISEVSNTELRSSEDVSLCPCFQTRTCPQHPFLKRLTACFFNTSQSLWATLTSPFCPLLTTLLRRPFSTSWPLQIPFLRVLVPFQLVQDGTVPLLMYLRRYRLCPLHCRCLFPSFPWHSVYVAQKLSLWKLDWNDQCVCCHIYSPLLPRPAKISSLLILSLLDNICGPV